MDLISSTEDTRCHYFKVSKFQAVWVRERQYIGPRTTFYNFIQTINSLLFSPSVSFSPNDMSIALDVRAPIDHWIP